jgi:hypothetical protein
VYTCLCAVCSHLEDRILKVAEHANNQVAADAAELLCLLAETKCTHDDLDGFDIFVLEDYVDDITDAVERLHEVAGTAQKRQAKKDRGETRTTAKLILRAMDEGESPEEVLTIRRQAISFNGWKQLAQLDFLRAYLAQGLDVHLVVGLLLPLFFLSFLFFKPCDMTMTFVNLIGCDVLSLELSLTLSLLNSL